MIYNLLQKKDRISSVVELIWFGKEIKESFYFCKHLRRSEMKPDFSVSNIHVWTENMGSGHIQYTWKHLEYSIHRSISNTVHIKASRIQYTSKHLEYSIHRSISNAVYIEASRMQYTSKHLEYSIHRSISNWKFLIRNVFKESGTFSNYSIKFVRIYSGLIKMKT